MVEFDFQKAILITYSGFGAAFAVLAFLIVFTLLIRLMEHLRNRSGTVRAGSGIEPGIDGYQEVPMITPDGPIEDGSDGAHGSSATEMVNDWKGYGRTEAFRSRMRGRRGT